MLGCITTSGMVYNNTEVWKEDPCTSCTCSQGRIKCHATMCHTICSNPRLVPGECCPTCKNVLKIVPRFIVYGFFFWLPAGKSTNTAKNTWQLA